MSIQTWQETLINSQADGPALTNSTTETSLLNLQEKLVFPSNYFQIGRHLKVGAFGRTTNVVTTPGTITFRLKFGATIIAASSAAQMCTTAKTNVSFWLEWLLTCRAIGSAGNLMHGGQINGESFQIGAGTANVAGSQMIPNSAPAVGANFDTSAAQTLDLTAQFSVLTATTSIQLHQYKVIAEV